MTFLMNASESEVRLRNLASEMGVPEDAVERALDSLSLEVDVARDAQPDREPLFTDADVRAHLEQCSP